MKIDNMKVLLVVVAATLTLSLSAPAVQAAIVTSTSSGDYQDGANFDTGNSPGPTDDAVITGGFDFTSSANIFVGNGIAGTTGFTRTGGVGSITVNDGSLTVTELGLAFLRLGAPSTASLNIGSAGSVDLNQVWFGAATGEAAANQNDVSINFTGAGGSLSVLTGFGTEGAGTFRLTTNNVTSFNVVNFEELFDLGFLTNNGLSGLDGAIFSENFAISEGGATITGLTSVPEPSSLAMLGLIGLVVAGRRRR